MKKTGFLFLMVLIILSACAPAAKPALVQNNIEIHAPQVTAAKAGEVSAVFLVIKNTSDQVDRLISVSTDAAGMAQIHETKMDNGVMSMGEVPGVDIPAGKEFELTHGGYHIMLMNLTADLVAGQSIRLTLVFEKAGQLSLDVPVVAP